MSSVPALVRALQPCVVVPRFRSISAVTTWLLASVACMSPTARVEAARRAALEEAVQVRAIAREYLRWRGVCPRDVDELTAVGIRSRNGYLDPWGAPFVIVCDERRPDAIEVRSYGPDTVAGTEDDVASTDPS